MASGSTGLHLDLTTLLFISLLVTVTTGAMFVLDAVRRGDVRSGRWWSLAFGAATLASFTYIAAAQSPALAWAYVVGNGLAGTATALIWVGARSFNGRPPLAAVGVAGPWLMAGGTLLSTPSFDAWSGAVSFLLVVAAYALVAAHEFWRANGTRLLNHVVLAVACAASGLFYAARATALVLLGQDDPVFLSVFGPEVAATVVLLLIVILTFSLVALGKEQSDIALYRLATRDALTDVLNRREFARQAELILRRLAFERAPVAVLLLDLDFFKTINDTHGHAAGDLVLAHFAAAAAHCLRPSDLLCRYGGEEFAVVLPRVSLDQAEIVAERMRAAAAALAVPAARSEVRLTTSIGLAFSATSAADLSALLQRADTMLYRAKAEGRNRVIISAVEPEAAAAAA
ncbi:GGDEF domain-containing protein [Phreatobacter stygius]|uniref:diguanylate cyclase n=1 Tax=Phreatobacter stygius TaxID=1940610 RepID=A0A4D7ANT9_9HYPH|nr:GGDEF domain-containing protein [Phreatobacter stygius]QCI62834.1 GGDEF domain-containing protein [Phreatobacter stygius]